MPEPQQAKKQRKTSGKKKEEITNEENTQSESVTKKIIKEPKKRGRKIKYTTPTE